MELFEKTNNLALEKILNYVSYFIHHSIIEQIDLLSISKLERTLIICKKFIVKILKSMKSNFDWLQIHEQNITL